MSHDVEPEPDEGPLDPTSAAEDRDAAEPGDEEGPPTAETGAAPEAAEHEAPAAASPENEARLRELDEALEKFTGQKRWSDVIKTILAKADLVPTADERIALLKEAGSLYVDRSANQAEAIKCFERVREEAPGDEEALDRLGAMYEKRRDWERLIGVRRAQADGLDPAERTERYLEMARLSSERLRKPELSIELWREVLAERPSDPEALAALGTLYEKARDWEPLAEVLEARVEQVPDEAELKQLLQKLGMIHADKLKNDEGALRAFQQLLAIDPDDRRAQEQLKRRYVALKAWDELEGFYATTGRWDELIRVFEREADGKDAALEDKVELLFRAARLWETEKEQPARAARAYEKILAADPENLRAADALAPIYRNANDARKLAAVNEVRLLHTDEPSARFALLRETAALHEGRLRDVERAFTLTLDAFLVDPFDEETRADVARLADATGGWARVTEAYEQAIGRAETSDQAVGLRLQFAKALGAVDRPDDAVEQYRAVLVDDPTNEEAVVALGELFEAAGRHAELLEILERRLEAELDPERRKALAYERARLLEGELEDTPKAIDAYADLLADFGDGEAEALAALDRLYQQEGRWAALAELLERRIALGPETEELAALSFRLGRVQEQHLDDRERAVELYRETLILMPEHEGAQEALEGLLADPEVGGTAAAILEPVYEVREAWAPLVRALSVLHERSDDPARRLELLGKVGEIQERHLEDPAAAFETFGRALAEAPDEAEPLARLEALAIEHDRFRDLLSLVAGLAERSEEPALSRGLYVKAARIAETQLDDVDAAVAHYRKVLEAAPDDAEVLGALESVFLRAERWRDLLEVLRRKVELAFDPGEKETVLARMASIHQERLDEPEEAIGLYKEVLDTDPTSRRALAALDGLFAGQERWGDLADNLERQLAMAEDPGDHVALMLRLAELRETRMGATGAAIEIYRDVLDQDPSEPNALGALERLLASPEWELGIAERLDPLYRDQGAWDKLVDVLEVRVRHAGSPARRVELLAQIAELQESSLDDTSAAFATWSRALRDEPTGVGVREELTRLAEDTGAWEALAHVHEALVEEIDDPAVVVSLLSDAARIREERLEDLEGAIGHWRRVLEVDDQSFEAIEALERAYLQAERYPELAETHLRKADMLPAPEDRKACLLQAASIHEEILDQPERAVEVLERVLEVDPDDVSALDKLVELHLRLERWESLLHVYQRKADVVVEPEERKRIFVEVGAVYEREVGDLDKAIDSYQRILEIDPDDVVAISRLDALYQASGNWQELLSVLEREADLAATEDEALGFRFRIADLWHRKLDDADRAVDLFRELLTLEPEHDPSIASLESMLGDGLAPLQAASVLEAVYEQSARWAELAAVYDRQVAHEDDPLRRVEVRHRLGEIRERELGDPGAALEAYAAALGDDDQNEITILALERLAGELGAHARVAALYDGLVEGLREDAPDRAADLALRSARLHAEALGDPEGAIRRYETVTAVDPLHPAALEALDALYGAEGRWSDLASVLEREAQIAPHPDAVLELQFRLAELRRTHLDDAAGAVEVYRDILATAPDHAPTVAALEALFAAGVDPIGIGEVLEPHYRAQGAWGPLLDLQEARVAHEADPAERVQMMVALAESAEEQADDPRRAFEWLQRALLEDPTDERTLSEAERLAGILGGWDQLGNTFAAVVDDGDAPEDARVDAGRRLARLFEVELGDAAGAEAAYRSILAIRPDDPDALEVLDRIYEEHGAHEALATVLARRVEIADIPADQAALAFRLGQVLEHDLGRVDDAVAVYDRILDDLDREHEQAFEALQGIHVRLGRWDDLQRAFSRALDVALGDDAQGELVARMARVASDQQGDLDAAVEHWKRVLDLRGEDPEALNALGDLFVAQENWKDLVDVLEREVAVADDDALRMRIYSDLARVWYGKLGRDRNALESWERVLDIDPGHTGALLEIAAIHEAGAQPSDLADALNRLIEVGRETLPAEALEAQWRRLADVYETKLEQPMDAVDAYREALALRPDNLDTLAALERIHRAEGQWRECVDVLEKRAAVTPADDSRIEVLRTIAGIWATELDDADGGTSAWERILEIDPAHVEAFEKLEALHRDGGRWEALRDLYVGRVDAEAEATVSLYRRAAAVMEVHLDDATGAFAALLEAWTFDPMDEETVHELERVTRLTHRWNDLLQNANELLGAQEDHENPELVVRLCLDCARWYGEGVDHPEYAVPFYDRILRLDPGNLAAIRQKANLHRRTGDWQAMGRMLESLAELTEEPRDKADVHVEMGALCEQNLGRPEEALGYYRKALEIDAGNVGALRALERSYTAAESWEDLLAVLRTKASAVDEPDESRAARLHAAEVLEDRLGRDDEAIAEYAAVLEIAPDDVQALKGLERLHSRKEDWPKLLEILERQLEVVFVEKERIGLLTRIASMWEEEFVKPDKAAERLEQVLDVDPNHEGALRGLERLYRASKRWEELLRTYERHIDSTPERGEKVRLLKATAEVHRDELSDPDRAVDALLDAHAIVDDDEETLRGLAGLYERREEYASALEFLERLTAVVRDPAQQVELRHRTGAILDEKVGDRDAAIEQFQAALDLDPGHRPSLASMRRIHVDGGEWGAAARVLEQEALHTEGDRAVARLLVELGRIADEKLDEHDRAVEAWEDAHRRDPENLDAALPLADEYFARERWDEALPLLQMLVKSSEKREPEEQRRLAHRLGETAVHLGNDEEAVRAFARAHQVDPSHRGSLFGLAAAHYRLAQWDEAFQHYQKLLVHHRDELGPDETTETFYRLGVVKREQGERRKALNMFDKALEEEPQHRPTLEAVVELHREAGDWDQVVAFQTRLLEVADDWQERFELHVQIGDVYDEQLRDLDKAVEAYMDADALDPQNRRLLLKLMAVHQKARQWSRVVEVISRVVELEEDAKLKARYTYTAGVLLRDELQQEDDAIARFNEALDLDPTQLKAFEAINRLLTERKDWKQLERAFRRMLHRVVGQGQPELEFNLWHNLGIIYRDRQKEFDHAAEAFRMASNLQPDNLTEHQILAELYAIMPERLNDAIEQHQLLLRRDPYRVDSYRSLYKLYFDARAHDKAWCLAATLSFLQRADAEQRQFYEQYKQAGPIRPASRVDNERWVRDLFHPDEDLYLSKMFEAVVGGVLAAKASPDKALGLQKKHEVDPMDPANTVTFVRTFGWVAQVLDLQLVPRLFLRPDVQGGLTSVAGSQPLASVCGSTLLSGFSPQDLTFVIGRHLTSYRPEHLIRTMLTSHSELKTILLAALRVAGMGPADPAVDQTAAALQEKLQPAQLDALRNVARRFVEAGGRSDVKQWMRAVELTACRAGFLLCNDLETAARMLQALPPEGPTDLPAKEKVKELVLFSVSESYFQLREALGIQIRV